MKKIQSVCNYCAIDCNLDFYVNEEINKIVSVKPTPGYPVNDGFCCINFQVAFCCNQFFNCLGLIYLFTTFCVFDIISLANKFCSIARVGASHCLAPHDLLNGN